MGNYTPSEGRLAASLGTATAQGAASTRNTAINAAYGQYTNAMDSLGGVANTGLSSTSAVAQRGLAELAGVNNSGIQAGSNMAIRGLESANSLAGQQANLDMQAASLQAQKDEAAKTRQGNMLGGLLGTAVDIGSMFIPGGSAISGITKKLAGGIG